MIEEDDVYMYEPPKDANFIPENALPEWYHEAARKCLLPDLEYGADYDDRNERKKKMDKEEYDAKYQNIGSQTAAHSSIMTFSFHVIQENVIKLYLYYNGQCIRFMAEDIYVVLPALCNMEYGNNKEFISQFSDECGYVSRLDKVLKDEDFESFYRICNHVL